MADRMLHADALARLLDIEALRDLGISYCASLDRADSALMLSLFHPDGSVITGHEATPIADYAPAAVAGVLEATAITSHAVSNQRFEFDGDRATGESYVHVANFVPVGTGLQSFTYIGRYFDRFERREGTWRFVTRTFVLDWSHTDAASPIPDTPFLPGGRGVGDPGCAYGIRARGHFTQESA